MPRLLKSSFGLSSGLVPLLLALTLGASSCGPLSFLPSGPNVAANVQAGAENRQAILSVESGPSRDAITKGVESGAVETLTVNNGPPPWFWLVALVLWFMRPPQDTIRDIWRSFAQLIGGKR